MTASLLNFDKENSIEIGASYEATIQLFDAPNLLDYQGKCDVKVDENASDSIINPSINVINHDTFTLSIPFTIWGSSINPGNFKYDVLFYKSSDRFYAIRGNMVLIKGITRLN